MTSTKKLAVGIMVAGTVLSALCLYMLAPRGVSIAVLFSLLIFGFAFFLAWINWSHPEKADEPALVYQEEDEVEILPGPNSF